MKVQGSTRTSHQKERDRQKQEKTMKGNEEWIQSNTL